jgi:uncharacterized protein (DUF697 family)
MGYTIRDKRKNKMPSIKDISDMWNTIREVDLRPLREASQQVIKIALVGSPGSGRHTLANQMRSDPSRREIHTQTPVIIAGLEPPAWLAKVDLIVLLLDAGKSDFSREQEYARKLTEGGKKILLFVNKCDTLKEGKVLEGWTEWPSQKVIFGSALNFNFLLKQFVPAVLDMLPDQRLALGRQFPLFRVDIARDLINETCFANAAYSVSTGVAEIVPVLDIPLNITDMLVLTKAQAFLVYKLGLVFGFSLNWQDYIAEFGSVVGGGFLWRQMARMLVGLIPVWGIVPKVAVSYAGTYVVGHVVLQWYLTGRKVTHQQISAMYKQAFEKGKTYARTLIARTPRPRLGRGKKPKALGIGSISPAPSNEIILSMDDPITMGKGLAVSTSQVNNRRVCDSCGKTNELDANFCQYCGKSLTAPA